MKAIVLAITLIGWSIVYGQEADTTAPDPNWKLSATYGVNGTQSAFVNWSAGGRNNISFLGYIEGSANYLKDKIKWDNDLGLALGGLLYVGVGSSSAGGVQKTDDRIDIATNFGFEMKEHWYVSFVGGFRTQFMDGFNFPNDSTRVSKWMAPGYVNLALGVDFSPSENFSVYLSPVAGKLTFVQDQGLANSGAFGVDPAEFDPSGALLELGNQFRGEFGAYFKLKYTATLAKNIEMKSKIELFSNYIVKPENIDVNAEVIFNFKVNNWFSASLNWNLIYDHDIMITDNQGNIGPRTQFKSVLGIGIAYTMRNFIVKKD
ncbi:MAG: DUF3078 domain-containing protein [Crocinitomicaceae bacterium]|nr:DUF3078 domain-containing protein [Crocinitomicaceae bacterium]